MLERPDAVYYVEQKAKIGTVEVALKPNTEHPYSLELTTNDVQIADTAIRLCPKTRLRCSEIEEPTLADGVIGLKITTDPILNLCNGKNEADSAVESIQCNRCSTTLTCKKFTRVLPLPSAAWYEMTDTLLCHGTHKKVVNGCFPRQGDCLVGEQELWVAWDTLARSRVYVGETRDMEHRSRVTAALHCHRCRAVLGRVVYAGDSVEWAVVWKHSVEGHGAPLYHAESYVARELLDASTRHVSFRFIVLPREVGSSQPFRGIRLWMMGGDLTIATSLSEQMNWALGQIGGRVSDNPKAMKVLYAKHSEQSVQGIWTDADVISLPLDLCLHLWLILQLSSLTLPPSKRYAQNCRVGYIRYV